MANLGPSLSEYGKRYYSNSLTKQEQAELHKQRMKNDPEYREKVKVDKLRKKAAAEKAKKLPAKKASTKKPSTPKTSVKVRGGGVGGMFNTKNR